MRLRRFSQGKLSPGRASVAERPCLLTRLGLCVYRTAWAHLPWYALSPRYELHERCDDDADFNLTRQAGLQRCNRILALRQVGQHHPDMADHGFAMERLPHAPWEHVKKNGTPKNSSMSFIILDAAGCLLFVAVAD